ncbi:hypothetical protein CKAN_01980300 [Cinnamomum micranthum f. kanehirae]|uniref:Uncharacterized protein n=1 Tax=Cinnamomum micranthum f. kanehirae TaxID=337451 RepID=A0A3S3MVK9_9MAGN|nr:hypothetical protein CKAN_01980300 [Cinnamomum micranthum f. kanehirae]
MRIPTILKIDGSQSPATVLEFQVLLQMIKRCRNRRNGASGGLGRTVVPPRSLWDSVADGRNGFACNDLEPVEEEADDDIGLTQANEMDTVFENALEDNDVSVGNARKRQFSSILSSRHAVKHRANTGQVITGAVETIANGFSEYANKHSKECPSVDKCINNLTEHGLPSGLYYKALRLLENERNAEFVVALLLIDCEG